VEEVVTVLVTTIRETSLRREVTSTATSSHLPIKEQNLHLMLETMKNRNTCLRKERHPSGLLTTKVVLHLSSINSRPITTTAILQITAITIIANQTANNLITEVMVVEVINNNSKEMEAMEEAVGRTGPRKTMKTKSINKFYQHLGKKGEKGLEQMHLLRQLN
jgi:hypothetical protein